MTDEVFIKICCDLALGARGRTFPNPIVGAVIVRDGEIIATGYHERAGSPHAEAIAIRAAGDRARSATLYVSLEPCCHHGRTPPCTDAIIAAQISRVVIGELDPNPRVCGGGVKQLRAAGIRVDVLPPSDHVRCLNLRFRRRVTTAQPLVTYKYACSLDGKLAPDTRRPQHLTGDAADACVHHLRADHDAIVVGVGTILADDPRLTVRGAAASTSTTPRPVVIDSCAQTPPDARIFRASAQPLIVTTERADPVRIAGLRAAGADVAITTVTDGRCDIRSALSELAARGIEAALLEGGGELAASMFRFDAVDRMAAIITPVVIGGRTAPTPSDGDGSRVMALTIAGSRRLGSDLLIAAWPHIDSGGDSGCSPESWSAWDRSLACAELLASGH